MKKELKTFEFSCDWCQKKAIVHSNSSDKDFPKGWAAVDIHNCGLTNYTRTYEVCEECLQKHEKETKKK